MMQFVKVSEKLKMHKGLLFYIYCTGRQCYQLDDDLAILAVPEQATVKRTVAQLDRSPLLLLLQFVLVLVGCVMPRTRCNSSGRSVSGQHGSESVLY
jgi:hypothetical protein